jgi:hypothetical protein
MFENSLYTSKRLDNVSSIATKVPKFSIMPLMSPPEGITLCLLELLELLPNPSSFVTSQNLQVFLKQSVDTWQATVPAVLYVLQTSTTVLSRRLLPLECVFSPNL